MTTGILPRWRKFEFESRIFISIGIVAAVSAVSFTVFAGAAPNAVRLGAVLGLPARTALALGFLAAAAFCAAASFLRIWGGSVLTSRRMMSFRVKADAVCASGPYRIVRNPIYFADFLAFSGFTLCLPPVGLTLPLLLYAHYSQLISYEEKTLGGIRGREYEEYRRRVPRLIPDLRRFPEWRPAFREVVFTRDGIRHNGLYLSFIPGFVVAALTGRLLWAVAIGLPAVLDWYIVHTKVGTAPDAVHPSPAKKVFQDILYANCWEDPASDREALRIGPDDVVFSITSGGCNVLTFLLDNPRKIIALDYNPRQNHLLELKMAAIRVLPYDRLLEFLGVRPTENRRDSYGLVRPWLSREAARFWDAKTDAIDRGVLNAGRYERYMRLLRKIVLVAPAKRALVERFFATPDPAEREGLFRSRWNDAAWKFLTRVMLSRRMNTLLFDRAFFRYLDGDFSFGRHFAEKAEHALTSLPLASNYFMSYILRGGFAEPDALPHYLREGNVPIIRDRLGRIEIVSAACGAYFFTLPDNGISKFNFSNIFEWSSPQEFEALLRETLRVARDGAVVTYRNLLVFREHPASLDPNFTSRIVDSLKILSRDLSFIYDNYVVEEIRKEVLA